MKQSQYYYYRYSVRLVVAVCLWCVDPRAMCVLMVPRVMRVPGRIGYGIGVVMNVCV